MFFIIYLSIYFCDFNFIGRGKNTLPANSFFSWQQSFGGEVLLDFVHELMESELLVCEFVKGRKVIMLAYELCKCRIQILCKHTYEEILKSTYIYTMEKSVHILLIENLPRMSDYVIHTLLCELLSSYFCWVKETSIFKYSQALDLQPKK